MCTLVLSEANNRLVIMETIPNVYGIYPGSMIDLFINSVVNNPNHSKYAELKEKYPLYFNNSL